MRAAVLPLALLASCVSAPRAAPTEPPVYRYACDYSIHDAAGGFQSRIRIRAVQSRGRPDGMIRWSEASLAFGATREGEFAPAMRQKYVDGFSYPASTPIAGLLEPGFYKGFPDTPLAFMMKNSILDAHVIDVLAAELDRLKPNEPTPFSGAGTEGIPLFGQGKQSLRRLDLTWVGNSRRGGRECAVVAYRSDIGAVSAAGTGMDFTGSTVFWGEIWVALEAREVEHATLYEHSLVSPPDPEAPIKSLQNIYRALTFERRR